MYWEYTNHELTIIWEICKKYLSEINCGLWFENISFGFVGLISSILVELIRHKNVVKSKGGFSIGYWFQDNFARVLLSIIIIIVGVLYSDDLVGVGVGNKGALVLGFCTDKIIETIISLKLTNVLSKLVKPKE